MQTYRSNSVIRTGAFILLVLAMLGLNLTPARAAGPLCYVNAGATGANDGASWSNAYTDLQSALAEAGCAEIWVAAGTYHPTSGTDRTATFQLTSGVHLYGGFAGTGNTRDQRDADPSTNNTILSGDIGTPGDNSDNSYHVVTGSGADASAVLDGFTVTAGKANASAPNNRGAGMYTDGGSPTVSNVIFSGNSASGAGGGMWNVNNSSPSLTNVTFSGNSAASGGGIYNDGTLTVTDSTFSGNSARYGGGVYNLGTVKVTNSTFSGNSAVYDGGGIENEVALTVTNSTFSDNSAGLGGGGIFNDDTLTVTNSTFSGNSADTGGGINNFGTLNYANTIIASSTSGGDCYNDLRIGTNTNNLVQDGSCSTSLSGNPNLGSLADNGGKTKTMALLPGSPAIDAGDDTTCAASVGSPNYGAGGKDQRGVARPQGPHCDIGAFEAEPAPDNSPPVITPAISGTLGDNGWYVSDVSISWTVTDDESAISSTSGCDETISDGDTAGTTLTCEATSAGGSNSASVTIQRDATPSVVSVTGVEDGASYEVNAVPTAGCDTQDALSGVATAASLSLSGGDGNGLGSFSATCDGASDNAGNTTTPVSASYTVTEAPDTYQFTGFLPLILNPPAVNQVKAGQAIPVKFSLNGDQGLDIFAAGYPASQEIACDGSAPVNEVEETGTAGNSGLSYDPDTDTYIYVWKTKKNWKGICRQLIVRLDDGSEHSALFQFK